MGNAYRTAGRNSEQLDYARSACRSRAPEAARLRRTSPDFWALLELSGGRRADLETQAGTAAKLLMYVDTVVEDARWLEPFAWFSDDLYAIRLLFKPTHVSKDRVTNTIREITCRKLLRLVELKPYIETGCVLFTHKKRAFDEHEVLEWMPDAVPKNYPIVDFDADLDASLLAEVQRNVEFWMPDARQTLDIETLLRPNLQIAAEHAGTCLALDVDEEAAYRNRMNKPPADRTRTRHLDTLVKLDVPLMDGTSSDLAYLRQADSWKDWRTGLRDALTLVEGFDETAEGQNEARGVIYAEMKKSTQRIIDAAATGAGRKFAGKGLIYDFKLNLMGAAAAGATTFYLAGVNPLVGGAAGFASAVTKDVYKASRFSKEGKARMAGAKEAAAISNLLLTFQPSSYSEVR